MRFILAKPIVAAFFIVATCSVALTQDGSDLVGSRFANGIAAIAEEKIITAEDVRREIAPYLPQIQQDAGGDPMQFRQLLNEAEDQIIQNLTDKVLIVKDFFENKGAIPPSYIRNEVEERIIRQFDGDRSKFLAYLKSIGKTPEEYDEFVRDDMIYNFQLQRLRKTEAFVSPVQIQQFYEKNKDEFYEEEAVHLRLIQLAQITDEDEPLLQQTADEIIRKLDQGWDFAELASKHSQDSRREKGGDWGWTTKEKLVPELSEAAFDLQVGEHSQPIRIKKNLFILYIQDRRRAGHKPLEDVRPQIENVLLSDMTREAESRWLERLRRDGYVRRFN